MDCDENELDSMANDRSFESIPEPNEDLDFSEINLKERRTNVGPWKNVEEFNTVYSCLFGPTISRETIMKACQKMNVWKLRCLHITPASILSTLAIVEVQLEDDDTKYVNEMQVLYAGAFTRFLNYMCSTGQKGKMKTMYQIAMDIGIDPFVVDLRHVCSHGQTMPSINVLRRASEYCLNWLKEFYWDHEYKNQKNVNARNVRREDITIFDDHISELFQVYDISAVAKHMGCVKVNDARKCLSKENFNMIKKYSHVNEKLQIDHIQNHIMKNLENLIRQESRLRNLASVFVAAFAKMHFIFEIPALCDDKENLQNFVKSNRKLFRSIAKYGFIEKLFDELIYISENKFESRIKRLGTSFWTNEIVLGFIAFNKFKRFCNKLTEKDSNFRIENKDINNLKGLSKDIRKIYFNLGFDPNSIIIFGDHYKRPWSLSFSRNYIEERFKNVSDHTKDVLKNCLSLVYPPLLDTEKANLMEIVAIFCGSTSENGKSSDKGNDQLDSKEKPEKIYSLENDFKIDSEMVNLELNEENQFGIWSAVNDEFDWHLCPLGRLPWE